jgi:hypothetical protein
MLNLFYDNQCDTSNSHLLHNNLPLKYEFINSPCLPIKQKFFPPHTLHCTAFYALNKTRLVNTFGQEDFQQKKLIKPSVEPWL